MTRSLIAIPLALALAACAGAPDDADQDSTDEALSAPTVLVPTAKCTSFDRDYELARVKSVNRGAQPIDAVLRVFYRGEEKIPGASGTGRFRVRVAANATVYADVPGDQTLSAPANAKRLIGGADLTQIKVYGERLSPNAPPADITASIVENWCWWDDPDGKPALP